MLLAHARTTARGAVLEVSFLGEKGSGTGVIREFFSLVANALRLEEGVLIREDRDSTASFSNDKGIATGHQVFHFVDIPAMEVTEFAASTPPRYVHHPAGLFPRPLSVVSSAVLRACGIVGRMIGQALQDGRVFPLPLSVLLFASLLRLSATQGRTLLPEAQVRPLKCLTFDASVRTGIDSSTSSSDHVVGAHCVRVAARAVLHDALLIDILRAYLPHVASSMLPAALRRSDSYASSRIGEAVDTFSASDAAMCGTWLTFEHPETGADLTSVELSASRTSCSRSLGLTSESLVTYDTVDLYVAALAAYSAWGGVQRQLQTIYASMCEVVRDDRWLRLLGSAVDLRDQVCGSPSVEWTEAELRKHVVASHGYSHSDSAVRWFISALVEMNQRERSEFLQFATGQPVLPPGGVGCLSPPLTVIRKTDGIFVPYTGNRGAAVVIDLEASPPPSHGSPASGPGPHDRLWISASTCFHQVKLPPFSSQALLRLALQNAVVMSAGLIDLS